MIKIKPAAKAIVTKVLCPACRNKVQNVGLLPDSNIKGLTFRCKSCGNFWELSVTPNN